MVTPSAGLYKFDPHGDMSIPYVAYFSSVKLFTWAKTAVFLPFISGRVQAKPSQLVRPSIGSRVVVIVFTILLSSG